MSEPVQRRIRARVSGVVQGVFYRASARARARSLGLSGWVRNVQDGSVALEAQGAADAIASFLAWCHQGPPAARVAGVEVEELAPQADGDDFQVRY